MQIKSIPCSKSNHGGKRPTENIKYIVVHYTGGNNDTAENNGFYFSRNCIKTSAHYFVDENEIVQSVSDDVVAWHCGANQYSHPSCRNSNSLGVEICTKRDGNGVCFLDTKAMDNSASLIWYLMEKYQIPLDCVVRHYDVTRKDCPAPMVGDGESLWKLFKERIMEIPDRIFDDVPSDSWYSNSVKYCVENGLMNGVGEDRFEPDRPVTRAELATVLFRITNKRGT